jgi:hypothetical protein
MTSGATNYDKSAMEWEQGKVSAIKRQIEIGEYHVDTRLVAEAIIRRIRQNACSKPARDSSVSVNATSGAPSTTDPIHVIVSSVPPRS